MILLKIRNGHGVIIMKLSKSQHKIYDIIISVLAAAAVFLVIVDLSQGLNEWQTRADQAILSVFPEFATCQLIPIKFFPYFARFSLLFLLNYVTIY